MGTATGFGDALKRCHPAGVELASMLIPGYFIGQVVSHPSGVFVYQTPSPIQTVKELLIPFAILQYALTLPRDSRSVNSLPNSPVIVLPGLGSSDLSTYAMRRSLTRAGLHVFKGGFGRNNGDLNKIIPAAEQQLLTVAAQTQQPVVLIGWSLGGIIARSLARSHPSKVRAVCCLGSPIVGGGRYTAYAPIYQRSGYDLQDMEERCAARESIPITVPSLSLYSKQDGIVHWKASIDHFNSHTENIEVGCRHFSMGFSTETHQVIVTWLDRILSPSNT